MPSGIDSHSMPEGSPSIAGSIATPPEAAADPPCDPSADIADRTRFERERFGNAAREEIEGEAFVVADPDHGILFDPGVSLMQRAIHSLLSPGHFQSTPDRTVTVLLFSSHPSFVAFSKERHGFDPQGLRGYYRHSKWEVLVDGTSGLPTGVADHVTPDLSTDSWCAACIDQAHRALVSAHPHRRAPAGLQEGVGTRPLRQPTPFEHGVWRVGQRLGSARPRTARPLRSLLGGGVQTWRNERLLGSRSTLQSPDTFAR